MATSPETAPIDLDYFRREEIFRVLASAARAIKDDGNVALSPTIESLIRDLHRLTPGVHTEHDYYHSPQNIADTAMAYIQDRMANRGLPGFPTGFNILDDRLGGWEPDNIYVLNAKPATGKTTALLQWAWTLAQQRINVVIYSPEARVKLLSRRLISGLAGVPQKAIRRGDITSEQFNNIKIAEKLVRSAPIHVFDMPELNTDHMERISEKVEKDTGSPVRIAIIDYLQQMEGADDFSHITKNMKDVETFTVRNNLVTIIASQIGRGADGSSQDAGKGSGKIEELASVVFSLLPFEGDKKNPDPQDQYRRLLVCSKNREEGQNFKCGLKFNILTGWFDEEESIL